MLLRLLICFYILIVLADSCSFVTTSLKTRLKGEGFHRILHISTEISSLKRLIDCRVSYYFQIPRGAFVDTDALNVSLLNHCFLATPFNTELPANHPALNNYKPIIFQSNTELRKIFVFSDELDIPIHFRYHPPSNDESGLSDPILIQAPTIYLHCNDNKTMMEENSCRTTIEKLACTCNSRPKCEFFRLSYKIQPKALEVRVPVGKLWQAKTVVYSTIFFVLALVSWTIIPSLNQKNDN